MYSSNHHHSHSNNLSGKVHPHHTQIQSNSTQDHFQQNCQIGLPIYVVNMNNNPSQNIQPNPDFVVQNNPNQINPSLPNPEIIYCIQINPSLPNPEKIYCTTQNKARRASKSYKELTQAVRQINSELNLAISNLNLIGNLNLLSCSDMEQKVISQIIENNSNVSSEKIRQGKVVYCCTFYQQNIRKYGSILLGLLCFITTLVIVGYSIAMTNNTYDYIVIPYIFHMILWGVQLLCALYGILRCSYRVIKFGLVVAFVNTLIYGILIIVVTLYVTLLGSNFQNSFEFILGIQVTALFVGFLVIYYYEVVQVSMNRFLILVKELEEKKIDRGTNY